jgi:hypothetical protein
MKKQSISFNEEMINAILDGRKTQTRRPLEPQPVGLPEGAYCDPYNKNFDYFTFWTKDHKMCLPEGNVKIKGKITAHWKCLYGKPGDRIFVKQSPNIKLEITKIRVERLQNIGHDDIKAEGLSYKNIAATQRKFNLDFFDAVKHQFLELWDSIYGKTDFAWNKNPWVWVIEFKRVG